MVTSITIVRYYVRILLDPDIYNPLRSPFETADRAVANLGFDVRMIQQDNFLIPQKLNKVPFKYLVINYS